MEARFADAEELMHEAADAAVAMAWPTASPSSSDTGVRARYHRRSALRAQPTVVTAFSSKAVASRITFRAAPGGQSPVDATGRTVCESKGVAPGFQPVRAMVSTLARG